MPSECVDFEFDVCIFGETIADVGARSGFERVRVVKRFAHGERIAERLNTQSAICVEV